VFVDTGYFLALLRKRDSLHEAAVKASGKYDGPFLTTDLVLVEIANALSLPAYRASAVNFMETRIDRIERYIEEFTKGMLELKESQKKTERWICALSGFAGM